MNDQVTVLFANDSFYVAFAGGDVSAMHDLWSERDDITCIHPGWTPIEGRSAVMRSWRGILLGHPPQIVCRDAAAHLLGDVAYVVCFEQINDVVLAATNIFAREHGAWKMVHHQASASPAPTVEPSKDSRTSLQ